jgi:hypothetical protein
MAFLFVPDASSVAPSWLALALGAARFFFSRTPSSPLRAAGGPLLSLSPSSGFAGVQLVRLASSGGDTWILLCAPDSCVRVNGLPVLGALRVLRDRDEIVIAGCGRFFFSSERLARVEPFPGSDRDAYCPRCKDILPYGTASVRCPGSGIWHHQSADRACWTYAETCACGCGRPTDLGAGLQWTPDGS